MDGGWHDRRAIADFRRCKPLTTVGGYAGVAYPSCVLLMDDILGHIRSCVLGDETGLLWRNDDIVLSSFVAKQGVPRILLPSLSIGTHNKERSEPSLDPRIYTVLDAARHPLVCQHLLASQPLPARLLLGDVVVLLGVFLLFVLISLNSKSHDAVTLPLLCVLATVACIGAGYSRN